MICVRHIIDNGINFAEYNSMKKYQMRMNIKYYENSYFFKFHMER